MFNYLLCFHPLICFIPCQVVMAFVFSISALSIPAFLSDSTLYPTPSSSSFASSPSSPPSSSSTRATTCSSPSLLVFFLLYLLLFALRWRKLKLSSENNGKKKKWKKRKGERKRRKKRRSQWKMRVKIIYSFLLFCLCGSSFSFVTKMISALTL